MADLTRLTTRYESYGIQTRAELGEYYCEFIRITDYLITKEHLSERERNIAYESGFDEDLKSRIKTRLRYREPEHFHDEPYRYKTFHECAQFLLASMAAASLSPATSSATSCTSAPRTTSEPI